MKVGKRVRLISFKGGTCAPSNVHPPENYWLLCGQEAEIVALPTGRAFAGRVLVKFAVSVSDLGLHCHNEIPNSLWIHETDLAPLL